MAAERIEAEAVGLPRFEVEAETPGGPFTLSSHKRAREALEFGLSVADPGFNVFVLGEDRSGRMTATLEYLHGVVASRPPPGDWVYLDNFRRPHRPKPYRLPAGTGRRLRDRMAGLVAQLRQALLQAFSGEEHQAQLRKAGEALQAELQRRIGALRAEARRHGLDLAQTPQGPRIVAAANETEGAPAAPAPANGPVARQLAEGMGEIQRWAVREQAGVVEQVRDLERALADQVVATLLDPVVAEFGGAGGLGRWLTELRVDLVENFALFRPQPADAPPPAETPELRYAVNLFVDHADDPHPGVVLEANPTYENLFGRIEYRQTGVALRTDFTLIQAGSLHRANGGILVLRAEALAADKTVWEFLKGALRDRAVRIEEPHRAGAMPVSGASRPKEIPLEVKVVIVGAPRWYAAFFAVDPDFQTYFKVKADIDPDMDASPRNLATYVGLIHRMARDRGCAGSEPGAMRRLLGTAARWADRRDKLTARFELIEDVVSEALRRADRHGILTEESVVAALAQRHRRNARGEDRLHEAIGGGMIAIDTAGAVVGQVNALTVRDLGDHVFGMPARVTARASIGQHGVLNIEREAALGGPIQQKGVMVLQGFLAGLFARRIPLSFNCSITFEQSYGGVEGDSASLAELLAIVSDLAGVTLRQDLAITGSVNQRGEAQVVGGIRHKIEGFFRTCAEAAALSGTQGVVIPASNRANLVLRDEIAEAVAAGRFHLWAVTRFDEALELFTGMAPGTPDAEGHYPPGSVYARVMAQLAAFDRILAERRRG